MTLRRMRLPSRNWGLSLIRTCRSTTSPTKRKCWWGSRKTDWSPRLTVFTWKLISSLMISLTKPAMSALQRCQRRVSRILWSQNPLLKWLINLQPFLSRTDLTPGSVMSWSLLTLTFLHRKLSRVTWWVSLRLLTTLKRKSWPPALMIPPGNSGPSPLATW